MISISQQRHQLPTAPHHHRLSAPTFVDPQTPRSVSDLEFESTPMNQAFYPSISLQQSAPVQAFEAGWEGGSRVQRGSHQRNSSSSSIGSAPSTSSAYSYGYNTSPNMPANKFESFASDNAARAFSNNLPTPTQTPISQTFNYSQAPNLEPAMAAHMALKQDVYDRSALAEEDLPAFSHSARHSVSSFGNSPSTPHADAENGEHLTSGSWMDAYFSDLSRFPAQYNQKDFGVSNMNFQQSLLPPFNQNQKLSELLQKANKNRSHSPSTFASQTSPFRQSSPLAYQQVGSGQAQGTPLRQHQEYARQSAAETPATISPKDAVLEYNEEDSKMPLFPDGSDYQHLSSGFAQPWMTTAPSNPAFTFTAPAEGHVFSAPAYRPAVTSEPTPDFPAHLTRMESSVSEAPDMTVPDIPRPESTLADSGTYSCTYNGCSNRFDSPQKLQKHKRDVHRQTMDRQSSSSPCGSLMSSADLLARNSQAGPHKCSRINPTTGKPCNTIFSRPYDLTRHEDTIHNNIKQKVRCAYCTEEKTFSRNDALTRHMRVVHSDVNFPGKHRRRGQE